MAKMASWLEANKWNCDLETGALPVERSPEHTDIELTPIHHKQSCFTSRMGGKKFIRSDCHTP